MRIPVKAIAVGIGILYSGVLTKVVYNQHEHIDELEKKLKKTKKKAKKYKKELQKPPYRRTMLPRNARKLPKCKPKYPIGFS